MLKKMLLSCIVLMCGSAMVHAQTQPAQKLTPAAKTKKTVSAKAVSTGASKAKACKKETLPAKKTKAKTPYNKYPMSMFNRLRSAKTVGKNRLSVAIKAQFFDFDKVRDSSGCYGGLGDDNKANFSQVLTMKYGWSKNNHVALGIPYIWNNAEIKGKTLNNNGLGNIFVFNKWNPIKETKFTPAVAVDVWHFFGSGNSSRKVGSDDYSWRFTTEISKAWNKFSFHVSPGYQISEGRDCDVTLFDAGVFYKATKTILPAIEYNYTYKETKGRKNDLIPGIVWKFAKGASLKLGAIINLDTTMKYKDDLGFVLKIFYKF